jgi:hypothetical protein
MIQRATSDDLVRLFDLEKAASTAALGHIFGPDLPFPDDDVLARWRLVLDEPDVTVLLDSEGDGFCTERLSQAWRRLVRPRRTFGSSRTTTGLGPSTGVRAGWTPTSARPRSSRPIRSRPR